MASRPQVSVLSLTGEATSQESLPAVFRAPIRPDVVQFVHTNVRKNKRQAYAVAKNAGHQHSAESWGTGRAVSRIPRISGGGTNRSGQGAFGNMCRKGRMFAPTKVWRHWHRRVNQNQRRYAATSALAASALPALLMARGHRISNVAEVPLVLDSAVEKVQKTKEAVAILKKIGAYEDVERCAASRQLRTGVGKMRNRRHVMRRGPLLVFGSKLAEAGHGFRNLPGVDVVTVDALSVLQLAPGGHVGRFVIWSRDAFARLDALFGTGRKASTLKSNYNLPRAIMANADITRIINSDEVQAVVRQKKNGNKGLDKRKNPLRNLSALLTLNPYAATAKRHEALFVEARLAAKAAAAKAKKGGK